MKNIMPKVLWRLEVSVFRRRWSSGWVFWPRWWPRVLIGF